jgi:hypothetical protein
MNRRHASMTVLLMLLPIFVLPTAAQGWRRGIRGGWQGPAQPQGQPNGQQGRGPAGKGGQNGAEFRPGGRVVTGAPYSAVAVTERVQTLGDGTKLVRKGTATIYRDSEGRIRREQAAGKISPFGRDVDIPSTIFISDPVAGFAYTLYPGTKTGVKRPLGRGKAQPVTFPRPEQARREQGMRTPGTPQEKAARVADGTGDGNQTRREDLGRQTMEGLGVDGERVVTTIPVDRIGNDRPIEIVSEQWKSPDLKTMVMSRRVDPRFGENTFRLTNIERAEPAASLFVVPEDYVITSGRPGAGPMGQMKRQSGRGGRPGPSGQARRSPDVPPQR